MSQLICKKCFSSIIARDLTPKGRHRNYVCPVCGTPINASKDKYILTGILIFIAVLVFKACYIGISKTGLSWVLENYKSLLVILSASIALAFSAFKNSTYKLNSNLAETRPWLILSVIFVITLVWASLNLYFGGEGL